MANRIQIQRLLDLAKQLNFQDDVDHWEAELAKLDKEEKRNSD